MKKEHRCITFDADELDELQQAIDEWFEEQDSDMSIISCQYNVSSVPLRPFSALIIYQLSYESI